MIDTSSAISRQPAAAEALLHQEEKIVKSVPPGVQLYLAQPGTVLNRDLAEPDTGALEGLDLDFLGKRHAVRFQLHLVDDASPEHPHTGLRIAHPAQVKHRHGQGQNQVAELVLEAHGPPVANRKARSIQEIDIEVKEGLNQV